jgi:hypothetical protein
MIAVEEEKSASAYAIWQYEALGSEQYFSCKLASSQPTSIKKVQVYLQ